MPPPPTSPPSSSIPDGDAALPPARPRAGHRRLRDRCESRRPGVEGGRRCRSRRPAAAKTAAGSRRLRGHAEGRPEATARHSDGAVGPRRARHAHRLARRPGGAAVGAVEVAAHAHGVAPAAAGPLDEGWGRDVDLACGKSLNRVGVRQCEVSRTLSLPPSPPPPSLPPSPSQRANVRSGRSAPARPIGASPSSTGWPAGRPSAVALSESRPRRALGRWGPGGDTDPGP